LLRSLSRVPALPSTGANTVVYFFICLFTLLSFFTPHKYSAHKDSVPSTPSFVPMQRLPRPTVRPRLINGIQREFDRIGSLIHIAVRDID
jgi:hypothetical protein